jgi:hypothetical protein
MSRRKAVLNNDKRIIEKLKNMAFDDLKLEIDEDTPDDLLEAIRDAYDEPISGGGDSATQTTTGQPYRLTDSDDFPFGTYVQNQTGRIVTKHFRISDEYQIKQASFMEVVSEMGFERIYVREYYGHNNYGATEVWEKRIGGSTTLINISNIIRKWTGKVKKSYKDSMGLDVQLYSNDDSELYTELVEKIIGLGKRRKHESNNIALVIQTQRGYDTTTI